LYILIVSHRFRSNITDVTVIRSVSDAVEPSNKYSSMRRCNGFLRRPEILETVYSVEEDGDSENNQDPSESTENSEYEDKRTKNLGNGKGRLQDLYGSFERLAQDTDSSPSERPRDESQQAQVKEATWNLIGVKEFDLSGNICKIFELEQSNEETTQNLL